MSELKVIKIELNNHGKPIASIQGTTSYYGISPNDTFYPKSEADKVIAELKEKLNNSRNARKYWRKEYLIEYKESIHHKYKRCLAMREYCLCELEFAFRDTCIERSVEGCVRWRKWANTWLYLAEKFKEAK